jgi:hypothetical protein
MGRREPKPQPEPEPKRVTVRWPGGPHDFVLEYLPPKPGWYPDHQPGWFWVTGRVVEPAGPEHGATRTLFAERIGPDEFRMIPMR